MQDHRELCDPIGRGGGQGTPRACAAAAAGDVLSAEATALPL